MISRTVLSQKSATQHAICAITSCWTLPKLSFKAIYFLRQFTNTKPSRSWADPKTYLYICCGPRKGEAHGKGEGHIKEKGIEKHELMSSWRVDELLVSWWVVRELFVSCSWVDELFVSWCARFLALEPQAPGSRSLPPATHTGRDGCTNFLH